MMYLRDKNFDSRFPREALPSGNGKDKEPGKKIIYGSLQPSIYFYYLR